MLQKCSAVLCKCSYMHTFLGLKIMMISVILCIFLIRWIVYFSISSAKVWLWLFTIRLIYDLYEWFIFCQYSCAKVWWLFLIKLWFVWLFFLLLFTNQSRETTLTIFLNIHCRVNLIQGALDWYNSAEYGEWDYSKYKKLRLASICK